MNLVTLRLNIRPFALTDDAFVVALLNDPDWIRYIGDRGVRTLEDARRQIADRYLASYARDGVGLNVVLLREPDAPAVPIGMCGLIKRPGLTDVDIGYAFLPMYRGKGYAFEAASAVLAHGREVVGLTRVVAITKPENLASTRLLEKIGLRYESELQLPGSEERLRLYAIEFSTPGLR
jgi:RimJ/RimL family protein N-acetyltransferase